MNIIIWIFSGTIIYAALIVLICIFFKGATQMANEWEDRQHIEEIIRGIELKEGF